METDNADLLAFLEQQAAREGLTKRDSVVAPPDSLPILVPLDLPAEADPVRMLLGSRVPWLTHGEIFGAQPIGSGPWLERGWKLHVSATPLSAVEVLGRVLPILLAAGVRFKAVNTRARLLALNAGRWGRPQIGKFITVYPSDDARAVQLAVALDAATQGLRGPVIPSDRPLRPGSLVHYRYGDFQSAPEQPAPSAVAAEVPPLRASERGEFADRRVMFYVPPPAPIVDPFEAAGVYVPPAHRTGPFAGRYLVLGVLSGSYRGGVFRAIDLGAEPPRLCVLKEFWRDAGMDPHGREASDWAATEADILTRYAGDRSMPRLYDRFKLDGNTYLALEYIEGVSLQQELSEAGETPAGVPVHRLIAAGRGTGEALARLHELGIVHGDCKPANLIRTAEGQYRLIDFGIAYEWETATLPPLGCGTRPYASPAQLEGERFTPADDVFAWGAVLRRLACGTDGASGRSDPASPATQAELRAAVPAALAAVIERAVALEPAGRHADMREGLAAFEAAVAAAAY